MSIEDVLEKIKNSARFLPWITAWEVIPERKGIYEDFPDFLNDRLKQVLKNRGIEKLYSHQASAIKAVQNGDNIVVVTPTASGKTMCYNLPVLNTILQDSNSRALYLFPTKALSQDQVAELHELIEGLDIDIKTYTYDGDTPKTARKTIRSAGHIIVTNPDMLHTGILPHHTKWVKLFENLKYVVIDEVHHYRGVFGSHTANVIRRLKRICRFYGSEPRFICCSATIVNPKELAESLTEEKMVLIDNNGAPSGKKHFIFYNPPVVNRQLGIRRSVILETKDLALEFLKKGIQTIIFGRSRLVVEIILSYLKEKLDNDIVPSNKIAGYRGGYLPKERRAIEKGLREGEILGVVSTNALELGIDIGKLDVCVMAGYPGSVSSTWQQAGRAGRRSGVSAALLVASSSPLDQYIINHPDYFFQQPPENGLINPDNLFILVNHIKCAAFELPFEAGETFGKENLSEILEFLEEERVIHHSGNKWYWMSEAFPAEEISLRSASSENFVIIDITNGSRVIGEVDRFSAPMLIHEKAIYIHGGNQYQIEKLDYEERKAYAREVKVNYYTDANLAVDIKVIDEFKGQRLKNIEKHHGEVNVTAMATMFKKIKFHTHENIGYGPIKLPAEEMHTSAYWINLTPEYAGLFNSNEIESGMLGVCNVLTNAAPIYLMCDPQDIRGVFQVRSPFTKLPTIYIYESYPGGVGFSSKLFEIHDKLLTTAFEMIESCRCEQGCPSCVGPVNEVGSKAKEHALKILKGVLNGEEYKG